MKRVLGAVLAVGNVLNQGTAFGSASAVRIECLQKLAAVRVSARDLSFTSAS